MPLRPGVEIFKSQLVVQFMTELNSTADLLDCNVQAHVSWHRKYAIVYRFGMALHTSFVSEFQRVSILLRVLRCLCAGSTLSLVLPRRWP